jgi:TPR repeat protein
MRSLATFTAEDLYLDGTAKFAGPDELNFNNLLNARRRIPENLFKLGIYHLHGYGCTKDEKRAIDYFIEASIDTCPSASYCLYRLHPQQPLSLLCTAVLHGHEFSRQLLRQIYADTAMQKAREILGGAMHLRDYHKAFYILEALGKSGHAEAYYQLAVHTESVLQDEANLKNSFNWALQAAKLGHTQAQAHVGMMYMQGRGTNIDMVAGLEWHEKAALGGHEKSRRFISRLLDS